MKHDHPDSETRKKEKKMLIDHALQGGGLRGVWARTNMHYVHRLIDFFLRHPEKWMAKERYNTAALRADLKKTTTLYDDQPAGNQPTRRRRAGARPPGTMYQAWVNRTFCRELLVATALLLCAGSSLFCCKDVLCYLRKTIKTIIFFFPPR
jgi:hypothetical protein